VRAIPGSKVVGIEGKFCVHWLSVTKMRPFLIVYVTSTTKFI
jgi:hypothetical protein